MKKQWKILCIGNSFSQDTTRLLSKVALACGAEKVRIVNLYLGGCSVRMHWQHASKDLPVYRLEDDRGHGLMYTPSYRISQALAADSWDWVCIQQGSRDGSFYSREESYDCLPKLVSYIRQRVNDYTRIAFNMTWVGEPEHTHREMVFYGGDQVGLYQQIADLTQRLILPMEGIDCVSPVGTAIQNARTCIAERLTRDGYHLSLTLGRYIAALTFWKTLTGADIRTVEWMPEDVDEPTKKLALRAVCNALETPFSVTE